MSSQPFEQPPGRHRLDATSDRAETSGPAWDWQWEDYLYPSELTGGTEVLRNTLGLHDPDDWIRAERVLSAGRQLELAASPSLVERTFTVGHWRAIHAHLFGDMYSWAGQFRSVDFAKFDGIDRLNSFAHADDLDIHARDLMSWVRDEAQFADRPRPGVLAGLTVFVETANMIHPFREGNGRTLRVLAEHLAAAAGYRLDWSKVPGDLEHAALVMTYRGQDHYLADALDTALTAKPFPIMGTGRSASAWPLARSGSEVLAASPPAGPDSAFAPAAVPMRQLAPELGE